MVLDATPSVTVTSIPSTCQFFGESSPLQYNYPNFSTNCMSRGKYMRCCLLDTLRRAARFGGMQLACSRSMLVPPAFSWNTYNHPSPRGVHLDLPFGLERITNVGIEAECPLCAVYALVKCTRVDFFPLRLRGGQEGTQTIDVLSAPVSCVAVTRRPCLGVGMPADSTRRTNGLQRVWIRDDISLNSRTEARRKTDNGFICRRASACRNRSGDRGASLRRRLRAGGTDDRNVHVRGQHNTSKKGRRHTFASVDNSCMSIVLARRLRWVYQFRRDEVPLRCELLINISDSAAHDTQLPRFAVVLPLTDRNPTLLYSFTKLCDILCPLSAQGLHRFPEERMNEWIRCLSGCGSGCFGDPSPSLGTFAGNTVTGGTGAASDRPQNITVSNFKTIIITLRRKGRLLSTADKISASTLRKIAQLTCRWLLDPWVQYPEWILLMSGSAERHTKMSCCEPARTGSYLVLASSSILLLATGEDEQPRRQYIATAYHQLWYITTAHRLNGTNNGLADCEFSSPSQKNSTGMESHNIATIGIHKIQNDLPMPLSSRRAAAQLQIRFSRTETIPFGLG
ncbi:hypothetical protein B0H16DRAFT_1693960 [Mycena metata]|uniref:Uncharacterized protein n=1 Tax=Mycena metata TaxID=1033252 RepID=A0AAD7N1G6_9AGAR|nr:hypothetical protein B0H16DRAFT_1693960 [Mycena metata]